MDVCFGRQLSCIISESALPFFTSSVIKDKSELNERSSASVLFSSRSRHSSKTPNLFPLWISEYPVSLVFICGSGAHPFVRIMPLYLLFPSISPYLCKTSCPKHDVKLHHYALTITTTTHGTCLWSRYPVLVIIHELGVLTSRPSVAS